MREYLGIVPNGVVSTPKLCLACDKCAPTIVCGTYNQYFTIKYNNSIVVTTWFVGTKIEELTIRIVFSIGLKYYYSITNVKTSGL